MLTTTGLPYYAEDSTHFWSQMLELTWKFPNDIYRILNIIRSHYLAAEKEKSAIVFPSFIPVFYNTNLLTRDAYWWNNSTTASGKSPHNLWSDLIPTTNKRIHSLNLFKQYYQLGTKCSKSCTHDQRAMSEKVIDSRSELTSVDLCSSLDKKFPIGSVIWILGPQLVALFE